MSFSLNTTGGVGSRFVSQKDLDEAKATKDKDWADAYARCVPVCRSWRDPGSGLGG